MNDFTLTFKNLMNNFSKRRSLIFLMSFIFGMFVFFNYVHSIKADELEKVQKDIEKQEKKLRETEQELDDVIKKSENIKKQINQLSNQIVITSSEVNKLEGQILGIQEDIKSVEGKLERRHADLNEETYIRDLALQKVYKTSKTGIISKFLSDRFGSSFIKNFYFHSLLFAKAKKQIVTINEKITKYNQEKSELEKVKQDVTVDKQKLAALAKEYELNVLSASTEKEELEESKEKLEEKRKDIKNKLEKLTKQQEELLQAKTGGSTSISVSDTPDTGDPNASPDYDPGFKDAFAAFSFGAPHRKGMSQYGAKGRAEKDQDYKEILKAYYGDVEIKEVDLPDKISTTKGTMELEEDYLYGLAEMPSSWPEDALKAQAIAARTYALAYGGWRTDSKSFKKTICVTEYCQVWSSSKANSSSAKKWHEAVDDTKGKILVSKKTSDVFSALYAATSGGYNYSYSSLGHSTNGGWDTKCDGISCWTSDAYENIADSPWFYKGWYKTRSGKSCGRKHPWLNEEEFADIIGAALLYEDDEDNQTHLSQIDSKSCWGKNIDDTWSMDKVRDKSGIKNVKSVKVEYSSYGYTSKVIVKTNKGEHEFNGELFKNVFNLRAPSAIHLKSMLYGLEHKD